jgi:hypothetical protein
MMGGASGEHATFHWRGSFKKKLKTSLPVTSLQSAADSGALPLIFLKF